MGDSDGTAVKLRGGGGGASGGGRGQKDHTSARSEAAQFLADLNKPSERTRTAKELFTYVTVSLKNEEPQFVEEFVGYLDSKDDQSVIHEYIYSENLDTRKVGIFLIVCLADTVGATRINWYTNFLMKVLVFPKNDHPTMDLIARALVYLIQTSKSYSADLLEKCLDQCLEWLQESSSNRSETRRLAAVLLSRELAMFTSTSFFLRANLFFKNIFTVIRDPKPPVRIAAIEALHAALTITSQREAKQKTEWYNTCLKEAYLTMDAKLDLPLTREDRMHSMLLVLNELVRIADADYERLYLEAKGTEHDVSSIAEPIEWLTQARVSTTVESTTARNLVLNDFDRIVKHAFEASKTVRNVNVQIVLLELFPRLSAWKVCSDETRKMMFGDVRAMSVVSASSRMPKQPLHSALMSLGLMVVQRPDLFDEQAKHVQARCREIIKNAGSGKKIISYMDPHVFIYLTLHVRAFKEDVVKEIKSMMDMLFTIVLSKGLTNLLHEITRSIPSLMVDVQDGLMKVLYHKLTSQHLPGKIEPPRKPLIPQTPIEVRSDAEEDIVLALDTLGSFEFQRHSLQMCMQYIAEGYLVAESVPVRLAAVRCCTSMLRPFVKVYTSVHREHRQWVLELVHGVLRCLVSVGVIDPRMTVRLCVFRCFVEADHQFLSHLAQPQMLELIFMSLHDEKLEMQEAAVCLLGRLSELNPALVLPRLRRVLLETLSQLTNSGQARLELHSARLLVQVARQSPKFMRPYLGPLLNALLPKLRVELRHVDVTVQVLNAISELCIVGGSEVVKSIDPLFGRLTQLVSDSSSLQRREAALQCIGRMCRATAYVLDPYRDYPTLLDDLLRLLKTEMSSTMRRQAIKVLGILGALDPYTHKVFTGAVQSANSISMALSLPMNKHDASDPRQDIIQWFNYEKCTLEEFYPAITIANLMIMVQDEAFTNSYKEITHAVLTIFRSLGDTYAQYVEQVVPRLIEVTRSCKGRPSHREFFLRQLAGLVAIIKGHAKPYLKDIFGLIADAWSEDHSVKLTVVSVLEQIGTALGQDFSPHVAELIPYLLQVVQTDREPERKITAQVLSCVRSLSGCLTPHLQLVLPPVLAIVDEKSVPLNVRQAALDTVLHLTHTDDVSDYAPRLMQTWQKCIDVPQLQPQLQKLLVEIVKQMWKHFEVFKRTVDIKLKKHGLTHGADYEAYIGFAQEAALSTSNHRPTTGIGTQAVPQQGGGQLHRHRKTPTPITGPLHNVAVNKQRLNYDVVSRAWSVEGLISKEDWTQWLLRLRVAFIKSGSSAAIRAAAPLSDLHQVLAKDLFNAAFMSVWTELKDNDQDELTRALSSALSTSNHPDVVQTILNLAEFMDHSEKGPLPIQSWMLRRSAEETKAFAKALRYTEIEIHKAGRSETGLTTEDCQALITFANKLNVQEEAAGVVRYAEQRQMKIPMQGRWYEKLNEWEKALDSYEADLSSSQRDITAEQREDIAAHELRCLEALGRWSEMNSRARLIKKKDMKVTVIAARGAWAVGDWGSMTEYVTSLNENSQDGSLLRAVLAVKNEHFDAAINYIDKVRDMYDSELTAMASESYERAYAAMVQVQQLAELEEAIEYKLRPERRPRIALLWSRRLQGCRQNIEQWQRLLMLRSLVLSPQEMHPLRVKFASLCRQQGKQSMCRSVLRDLLNIAPDAPLESASVPNDKPQLVLALCKQLWMDDMKQMAVNTLDSLVKHLDKALSLNPTKCSVESSRICAKAHLKLGQWTAAQALKDAAETKPGILNVNPNIIQAQAPPPQTAPCLMELQALSNDYQSMMIGHSMKKMPSLMSPQEQEVTKKVIDCYARATENDSTWHKAWHNLASAHLHAMTREKELAKQATHRMVQPGARMTGPPMAPPPPPLAPLTMGPPMMVPPGGGPPPSQMLHGMPPPHGVLPPFMSPSLSPMAMPPVEVKPNLSHAVSAVKCFAKALMLAPGSRLEDTLRLLQLWFDYGENEEVYTQLRDNIKGLPVETWLEVVPQLMARLDSTDRMALLIRQVIHEISKTRPQALVYALTVAAKSTNVNRSNNAKDMLSMMGELHTRLVDEARMVSEELVRCAILWHEQWHDALDDASRLYFQDKNIKAMMEILRPMHEMIDKGPATLKEQSFNQTYYCDLTDAFKFCLAYERNHNQKELSQAWEIYCQIFKRIAVQLRQLTSLDLNYISPLLMRAKDLELAVPGTYDPNSPVIGIASIGTHLQVISSKQRPRKMTIRGSDGHEYVFLLKGHEDPRQDERVMQLFGLVNTLLVNNAETCRRNLTIQRYSITALSQNSGLIGWVPNCDTLHSMIRDYREKKKMSLSVEHKLMQVFAQHDAEQLTLMQKMQVFQRALESTAGDDLRQILWLKSPSSEVWFDRRTNYTRSIACMSMVGYILGLGDRHPSNLMLDRLTGKIVHIDFGDCFDVAMTREKFPERVPFRLTRMLINAMEVTGIDGTYRFTCERVLRLLRTNKESLLAVLEAFVYDPVINWRLLDGTKKDPAGQQKEYGKKPVVQQEAPRPVSEQVMEKIRHKLTGREFNPDVEMGEGEQIDRLIEQATLKENLCQAYIGWCPFW